VAVLAKLGLSCQRARNGEEAIRFFREKRHNVVLLDRNLPDMDGTDVARRLRAVETDGHQSVLLAVTAYCTAEDRKLCLDAGMDAFVGKPLTPEKLRRVLVEAGRRMLSTATLQASTESTSPALDLSLLNYLSDGSAEGLDSQTTRFLDTLAVAQSELGAAWQSGSFERLAKHAHLVLGQARMVGASELASAATALERAAQNDDGADCRVQLQAVDAAVQELTAAMRRHRPASQSA
jgi:CheY-like chemotaxis protein